MPDAAMTLAVAALFAEGPTAIRDVYNWRVKETERMYAIVTELRKVRERASRERPSPERAVRERTTTRERAASERIEREVVQVGTTLACDVEGTQPAAGGAHLDLFILSNITSTCRTVQLGATVEEGHDYCIITPPAKLKKGIRRGGSVRS